jgi:predicted dehydrogenase
LFIEKPAIHKLENSDTLVQLIKEQKIINYVACNMRFHPCITFLKNKIETENLRINEVNVYCGSYLPDWRPEKDFKLIYSANASMGGGVHLDLFHELDYITWLFGLPKKSQSILRNVSSLNINAVDYANYILEYDNFTTSIILNYYRKKPKREIEIVFNNETLIIDLINNSIKDDNQKTIFLADNFFLKDTYVAQLNYFITLLTKNEKPFNSLSESINVLKIVLQNE